MPNPDFYIFYYENCKEIDDRLRLSKYSSGTQSEQVKHQVEIRGIVESNVVHVHVGSCGAIPHNVNYYEKTDGDNETTKIVVAFAKLVADGIVDLRKGESPL
jgi:hypothetical protein